MQLMVFLVMLLGDTTPGVVGYQEVVERWMLNKVKYKLLVPEETLMHNIIPVLFACWFQLRLTVWI